MNSHRFVLLSALQLVVIGVNSISLAEPIRVATYNIEHLKANVNASRIARIKAVIDSLDAQVIGLQEIESRAALNRVFDAADWQLVIDDESNDAQDVAVAVRRPLEVVSPSDLEADDEHFLFPGPSNNNWPKRRDGLKVDIKHSESSTRFSFIVLHLKARVGGRNTTDHRRIGAARDLVTVIEPRIDDEHFIVVGDVNDNPDDRSMNILETGDPDAIAGPEEIDGPLLSNLTESLLVNDHVSWGLSASNVENGRINTKVLGSRALNNAGRGTSDQPRPILFDQILVSPGLRLHHISGSTQVFDDPAAFIGGPRASDHLPVSAVFDFGETDDDGETEDIRRPNQTTIRLVAALPNPIGQDAGRESLTLKNFTDAAIDVTGWQIRDRARNTMVLSGAIAAGEEKVIELANGKLPLNNSGDDLLLLDAENREIHAASYSASQATPGAVVRFSTD